MAASVREWSNETDANTSDQDPNFPQLWAFSFLGASVGNLAGMLMNILTDKNHPPPPVNIYQEENM